MPKVTTGKPPSWQPRNHRGGGPVSPRADWPVVNTQACDSPSDEARIDEELEAQEAVLSARAALALIPDLTDEQLVAIWGGDPDALEVLGFDLCRALNEPPAEPLGELERPSFQSQIQFRLF